MARKTDAPPRYAAPALEKGLDILELLATRCEGMGQSQIARALGRTPGEIFRMLTCLERRGYLVRDDDRYQLTPKLFELAHHHPPTKRLLDSALPEMQRLAEEVEQSCHLAIRRGDHALIVAQVDSPGFIGFAVRVGRQMPLVGTCSGHVLLAWSAASGEIVDHAGVDAKLARRLEQIREAGFEQMPSPVHDGITDIGFPVCDHLGGALATLTMPYLPPRDTSRRIEDVRALLGEAAQVIASRLGGVARDPKDPR